jgi:hypothetical protein
MAARQSQDVQRRAKDAVIRQRAVNRDRWSLAHVLGGDRLGKTSFPSLDAWYRAQPVVRGRISPSLTMNADEKRLYGLPPSARLANLRGVGNEVDHWSIAIIPTQGCYLVGVKAPFNGGGVGVLWRKSWKASDYALRLSVEHGFPIRERWA